MRLLLAIIFIALLAGAATYLLSWWMIAAPAFAITYTLGFRPGKGFLAGFLGITILWLVVALYADIRNNHLLSSKMAQIFSLPNSAAFLAVTVLLGALIGGLAGLSGALVRGAFTGKKPSALG